MIHSATDDIIDYLNDLLWTDEPAIRALIEARVPCNEALANHPTVQVCAPQELKTTTNMVGFLGILNGFCGTLDGPIGKIGWGPISAICDDDGKILRFERTDKNLGVT